MNISTAAYNSPYTSQHYQSAGNSSNGQKNTHAFEEQIASAPTTTASTQKENTTGGTSPSADSITAR